MGTYPREISQRRPLGVLPIAYQRTQWLLRDDHGLSQPYREKWTLEKNRRFELEKDSASANKVKELLRPEKGVELTSEEKWMVQWMSVFAIFHALGASRAREEGKGKGVIYLGL